MVGSHLPRLDAATLDPSRLFILWSPYPAPWGAPGNRSCRGPVSYNTTCHHRPAYPCMDHGDPSHYMMQYILSPQYDADQKEIKALIDGAKK